MVVVMIIAWSGKVQATYRCDAARWRTARRGRAAARQGGCLDGAHGGGAQGRRGMVER